MANARPHVLGVDDGPFQKGQKESVPVVGAMMEGADLVESIAVARFEVDGADATGFLVRWISGLRSHGSTQAVLLGGITIAGLGVVDVGELAARLGRPVIVVNRKDPNESRLRQALLAAGLHDRIAILESTPPATRMRDASIEREFVCGTAKGLVVQKREAGLVARRPDEDVGIGFGPVCELDRGFIECGDSRPGLDAPGFEGGNETFGERWSFGPGRKGRIGEIPGRGAANFLLDLSE